MTAPWLTASPEDPLWVGVLVLALAGLALVAYAVRALNKAGALSSFVLGLIVGLLGGLGWLLVMVSFTLLGFIATRVGAETKRERETMEAHDGERGAANVIANGAAAGLAAVAILVAPREAATLAFATAMAAVTADTLASEIGTIASRARRVVPPFEHVRIGENGAVSWPGQVAALTGSVAIAVLSVFLAGVPAAWAWVPAVAGFLGCQLDSLLGATLERDTFRDGPLSKQDVNFIASAFPALVVLVIALV